MTETEHAACGPLLDQAAEALAFERQRADRAEAALRELADRTGAVCTGDEGTSFDFSALLLTCGECKGGEVPVDGCTCGAGPGGHYGAHEPGCGGEPCPNGCWDVLHSAEGSPGSPT